MILTGCDRLLEQPERLTGRRYGLLAHGASVTADRRPLHLALSASPAGPPAALFGPEHGFYGVEQDMIPSTDARDPWTGAPIVSLYGDRPETLRPQPRAMAGLEVLVIDLQDVGSRYYTYAATAVWAAAAAIAAGAEVWLLDRPNPLGGDVVEGNLRRDGYGSFVGAFPIPVRHGLTLGELARLELRREGVDDSALTVWEMRGWRRRMRWRDTGLGWIAPSPNIPTPETAAVYPGGCLIEGTELSEGRGTTRPFELVGAPGIDPPALAEALADRRIPGVRFLPTYFRPQFQKQGGELCGGVQVLVTDEAAFPAVRCGVELLATVRERFPEVFGWRRDPYEFVSDRPAIDLLAGGPELRRALDTGSGLSSWLATWSADEELFREQCRDVLIYS
ncbi:MAG: DUF1343 domain-containing protein [Thermoanaerobaculia bacterium]